MGSLPVNISASMGAAILNMSKWKSTVQAWLEIMEQREPGFCARRGYQIPEFEYNSAMKWGHAFESAVIELAEQKASDKIKFREMFFGKDFITCHVDGIYINNGDDENILHEGKTTSAHSYYEEWGEPGTDQVPQEYQIQAQHQLICTRAEKVILSVLVFPKRVEEWEEEGWNPEHCGNPYPDDYRIKFWANPEKENYYDHTYINPKEWAHTLAQMGYFHQYAITPNVELQQLMIAEYTRFWTENVLGEKEPEARCLDDIKMLCRAPKGTVVASEEIEYLVAELDNIKSEISGTGTLAKRADMIKVQVMDFIRKGAQVEDDESTTKWILKGRDGKKLMQYGKDKNGRMILR